MSDIVPVPLVWIRTAAFAVALLFASVFFLGRCSANQPTPLPPKVQNAIDRHVVASAVDTARVHQLERAATDDSIREQAAKASAVQSALAAKTAQREADSLSLVAARATTAADSATAWHLALLSERRVADSLRVALASQGTATTSADSRVAATDAAKHIETGRAARADSVVQLLVPLAEQGDHCRLLFGTIKCPTRKQMFVGGILIGTAGTLIATGKIKLPAFSLKF